jgi:outer membrane protein assembly factor BamB
LPQNMPNDKHRATLLGRLLLSTTVLGVGAMLMGRAPGPAHADDTNSNSNPDTNSDSKTTPDGVSIPDSPGASDRLDKAREKELQKQWKTAAEFYQEALAKYSGRVVLSSHDPDRGIFQYTGIAPLVQERIAKWPTEGLAAYRVAYGQIAADHLAAIPRRNTAEVEGVFWNYFATDAGKTAGIRLIDADLERGDYQAAKWVGNRLLNLHPDLGADRGSILYRTAVACYRAGEHRQAQALLDQLKTTPAEVGSIGGKDVSLVDSLTALLATAPPLPTTRPSDADTYPSFGGLGGHGDISTSTARPGASLKSIPLTKPEFPGLAGPQRQAFIQNEQATISNNLAMGIMPVVDAGALFFQDGRSIYAVDADSGAPLPGWMNTYSGERAGRYKLNVPGRVRNEPLTITVTPTAVMAVMGQADRMSSIGVNNINPFIMPGQMQGGPPSTVKLVCLDRDTGQALWVKTPAELPDAAAAVRTGGYDGTPLFIPANLTPYGEDCVVAIARGGRENQFDDCYAICLSLKTGQYKWSTYLGSATRSIDLEGSPITDPSQASLANGRVFVMTNLGTVASLDPADGRIIWLSGYAREAVVNPEQMIMNARMRNGLQVQNTSSNSAWAQNPVFVSDGYVFALPRDAKQLFVYDGNSGVEKCRIPMGAFDNAQVMLGVREGRVCVTSDKGVFVIDWQKYLAGDRDHRVPWHEDDITGMDRSEICGRGFVTSDSIYLSTRNRLIQKTWKSGRTVQNYPHDGSFTSEQGPGNILVTAHDVIVAGQTHVDVYTDLALVRQRFESAIAAAPNDPEPRIGYADALFAGGDMEGTLARVDQAIDLLGGMNSMRSGPGRERVFNTMLHYAEQSDKNKGKDKDQDSIAWENKFYDRAKLAAETPVENARYRLARAQFDHLHEDYAGEVELCQEILSDDAMRSAMVADDTTAGSMAESTIDIAVDLHRNAYEPIEEKASEALTAARATDDPEQLLAVATVYPNSRAASDARSDAVHRFEADNQPEKAINVLRRVYASTSDRAVKTDVLVSIANDFLTMPEGLGPALDRLCRAARIAPGTTLSQKLRLPDGTVLTNIPYVEAVTKLRQLESEADNAALPDFHLPPNPTPKQQNPFVSGALPRIPDVMAIVHPMHEYDRTDQILTWGSTGLCIYPAGSTTPLATIAQVDKPPLAAAWVHNHWMVWTPNDVYQISSTGKLLWDFPLVHLPTMVVSTASDALIDDVGDNDPNSDTNLGVNGNIQIVNGQRIRLNGRMIIRNNMMIQQPVAPAPQPAARAEDEQIAAVKPGGDRIVISTTTGRLIGLDFRGGQILWQVRPLDHTVDELLVNSHFTVARMDDPGGSQIAVYDTPTGHLVGRRKYGPDNSQTQLVNVALSEEATMAITLFNQVFVKDLYEPWKIPPMQVVAQTNRDIAPYVGLTQPDQLIVHGGRLACLYDQGNLARGYDLSNVSNPTNPKDTRANGMAVTMRMVGSRLFIQTPNEVWEYNLQDPTDLFEGNIGVEEFIPKVHTVLIGKDYVVSINDPVDRGPAGQPYIRLGVFRRLLHPGSAREWGDFDYVPRISSPSGIMDWTGTDGFLYYLSKDNTLHILRGARP